MIAVAPAATATMRVKEKFQPNQTNNPDTIRVMEEGGGGVDQNGHRINVLFTVLVLTITHESTHIEQTRAYTTYISIFSVTMERRA